jgi:anti-sigma regulatory factor (Ser/Thr protein kinase)
MATARERRTRGKSRDMSDRAGIRYDETIRLPSDPRAVRRARRFVDEALVRACWADLDRELAQLATSELVANAVVHAPGRLSVRCVVEDAARVEVTDERAHATLRVEDGHRKRIGGLGLRLVDQVSRAWGVVRRGGTKTVWCVLERRRDRVGAGQVVPGRP